MVEQIKLDIAYTLACARVDVLASKLKLCLLSLGAREDWETFTDMVEVLNENIKDAEIIITDNKADA